MSESQPDYTRFPEGMPRNGDSVKIKDVYNLVGEVYKKIDTLQAHTDARIEALRLEREAATRRVEDKMCDLVNQAEDDFDNEIKRVDAKVDKVDARVKTSDWITGAVVAIASAISAAIGWNR